MDLAIAQSFVELNRDFYQRVGQSFSMTRNNAWQGWEELAKSLEPLMSKRPVRVLDVAAGNLRFERFLSRRFPQADLEVLALDQAADMPKVDVGESVRVTYRCQDLITPVLHGESFLGAASPTPDPAPAPEPDSEPDPAPAPEPDPAAGRFDLVVSFGFMHHVPGAENRLRMLDQMMAALRPGGICVVSIWKFMDSRELAAKARSATVRGLEADILPDPRDLEFGDMLLSWQNDLNVFRFCHHCTNAEVDRMVAHVEGEGCAAGGQCIWRFRADGSSGNLNEYLVFQRK